MGRHAGQATTRSRWAIIGTVGVLAVLAVGGTAYAMTRGEDPPTTATSTSSTGSTSASASATSPSPSGSASASAQVAAAAAISSCVATLQAGDALNTAAQASAKSWGTHTKAELDFQANTITYPQAQALWASSKANAAAELAGFATADQAYTAVAGGCDNVTSATQGTDLAPKAADCAARSKAMSKVVETGTVVNTQWTEHVAQMANKDHMDSTAYHEEWLARVAASQPALQAFAAAEDGLTAAPACTA